MTFLRMRRSTGFGDRRRPRSVWAAFVTSLVLSVLIVVGVLLPILTLIGTAAGLTAGTVRVPVGQIVLALVIGYALALVLLALCVRGRWGPLAWILGVAAVISTLVVSIWPIVAVAISGVTEVQDVIPFIQHLVERVLDR